MVNRRHRKARNDRRRLWLYREHERRKKKYDSEIDAKWEVAEVVGHHEQYLAIS
jgi:hypothetical protein